VLLRHLQHMDKVPHCSVCSGSLHASSQDLALQTITLAASVKAEWVLGKTKMSKLYTYQDGIWVSTQRLEKEGLLVRAELDFTLFMMVYR
jgi:hypothetical protein